MRLDEGWTAHRPESKEVFDARKPPGFEEERREIEEDEGASEEEANAANTASLLKLKKRSRNSRIQRCREVSARWGTRVARQGLMRRREQSPSDDIRFTARTGDAVRQRASMVRKSLARAPDPGHLVNRRGCRGRFHQD